VSALGRRYARALLDLATEAGKAEAIGTQLNDLVLAWQTNRELREVFENPAFGAETRKSVLTSLGDRMKLETLLVRVLTLLSDRRRMRHFPEVADAYRDLAEQRAGRVRAEVITATSMSSAYIAELTKTLEQVTGKKVTVTTREDPSLIGGVVAKVGDKVFDGSLKTRLEELRDELLNR
jgi:F-type H+-transporting ATPase subunit delta